MGKNFLGHRELHGEAPRFLLVPSYWSPTTDSSQQHEHFDSSMGYRVRFQTQIPPTIIEDTEVSLAKATKSPMSAERVPIIFRPHVQEDDAAHGAGFGDQQSLTCHDFRRRHRLTFQCTATDGRHSATPILSASPTRPPKSISTRSSFRPRTVEAWLLQCWGRTTRARAEAFIKEDIKKDEGVATPARVYGSTFLDDDDDERMEDDDGGRFRDPTEAGTTTTPNDTNKEPRKTRLRTSPRRRLRTRSDRRPRQHNQE